MKKKIIFLNNHFKPSDGTVRALIGLVNHLDPQKYDITIRPIYRCDRSIESQLNPGIKLKKGIGFYFKGLSTIVRHIPSKWLYRFFIREKYDIEVAFQCDVPTIIVGNSQNSKAVHAIWMHGYGLYPKQFLNCDQVVCVSKYCAEKANREMDQKIHAEYLYNLVEDGYIREMAKEPAKIYGQGIQLVSVGRISPEKGYPRLIEILSKLRNEGFQFHMTIVGDGPEMPRLQSTVQQLQMNSWVTLVGMDQNPHKYTKNADLFICSSFSEGYSTACTEAAILGIPILTTDVPGGQEIVDDCQCGLVTGLDDMELQAGLRSILENPEMLDQWKKTMTVTRRNFFLETRQKQLTELFEKFSKLSDEKQKSI